MTPQDCAFCRIVAAAGAVSADSLPAFASPEGQPAAAIVHLNSEVLVFLDHRPVFPGHCLVIPKVHVETFDDLPDDLLQPVFATARFVSRALQHGLGAEGSFTAVNNRVSQSVPHLHVHVIPRRRKDGLRGFFWPRHPYEDEEQMLRTAGLISGAVKELFDN
ncbi:MAG: HIT family protein [Thermoleophilia bacterium]